VAMRIGDYANWWLCELVAMRIGDYANWLMRIGDYANFRKCV